MTIEEKIRETLNEYRVRCVHGGEIGISADQATQAILELVETQEDIDTLTKSAYLKGLADGKKEQKPMSKERLRNSINDFHCPGSFTHFDNHNYIGAKNADALADAILAEWEKGLK